MRITIESDPQASLSFATTTPNAPSMQAANGGSAPASLGDVRTTAQAPGDATIMTTNAGPPSDELVAAIASAPASSGNGTASKLDGGPAPAR